MNLPPDLAARICQAAADTAKTPEQWAHHALRRALNWHENDRYRAMLAAETDDERSARVERDRERRRRRGVL